MAFSKYQINNPWRSNTVKMNLLTFFLRAVKLLNEKYNGKGLSIYELPFLICWSNNNYEQFVEYIMQFREEYGIQNVSDEIRYKYCMQLLDASYSEPIFKEADAKFIEKKEKDYNADKLLKESPDELIRKLRLTQVVSLRGNGYFIDLNDLELVKINHIMDNYSNYKEFDAADLLGYMNYMGGIDNNLSFVNQVLIPTQISRDTIYYKTRYQNGRIKWIGMILLKKCILMYITVTKKTSEDKILHQIVKSTRKEFLVAIVMKKALTNAIVKPNYIFDDEGITFRHAPGNNADIVVNYGNIWANVEVTTDRSRSYQAVNEMISIKEHLFNDIKVTRDKNRFALFIAPIVQPAADEIAIIRKMQNINIYAWESDDFVKFSQNINSLSDYKDIRSYAEIRVNK